MPKASIPKEWKARLIQDTASSAVAHSAGYGAPVQDALLGAMAIMSALVRCLVLQGGTGVAVQAGSASEKMTNNALSFMMVDLGDFGTKLEKCEKTSKTQGDLAVVRTR